MSKVLGICAVATVAAGVAILVSKCMKAAKEDEDIYHTLDEEGKGVDSSLRNKMDEIFEQAVKTLDEMKASATEFYSTIRETLAEKKTEAKPQLEEDAAIDINDA